MGLISRVSSRTYRCYTVKMKRSYSSDSSSSDSEDEAQKAKFAAVAVSAFEIRREAAKKSTQTIARKKATQTSSNYDGISAAFEENPDNDTLRTQRKRFKKRLKQGMQFLNAGVKVTSENCVGDDDSEPDDNSTPKVKRAAVHEELRNKIRKKRYGEKPNSFDMSAVVVSFDPKTGKVS